VSCSIALCKHGRRGSNTAACEKRGTAEFIHSPWIYPPQLQLGDVEAGSVTERAGKTVARMIRNPAPASIIKDTWGERRAGIFCRTRQDKPRASAALGARQENLFFFSPAFSRRSRPRAKKWRIASALFAGGNIAWQAGLVIFRQGAPIVGRPSWQSFASIVPSAIPDWQHLKRCSTYRDARLFIWSGSIVIWIGRGKFFRGQPAASSRLSSVPS